MNWRELESTFIVAEIGVNHEGDLDTARDLVRKAARAGADAVKFQTYTPERYVSTEQPERLERIRRFQLSQQNFRDLATLAVDLGLVFFSTPLHPRDADFLNDIQPIFKISSGDLTFHELLAHVAAKGKPMILSTGLASEGEIRAAVEVLCAARPELADNGQLMLMHCVAAYPTPEKDANLRNIAWLKGTFGLPVGYSDHTLGTKACELAVAAGAVAVEKHFTYRKEEQAFHDHAISADPADLTRLVAAVRRAEVLLGSPVRGPVPAEESYRQNLRRSVAASVDIPAGIPVDRGWLTFLRPAWGLPPERANEIAGRRLKRDIPAGTLIREEDLA
ncbi:MAG: N-acetylneuraminate synthase family protein [Pseudomonadota bacterium]